MFIYYTDSSYNWQKTVNGKGTGRICIITPENKIIEEDITIEVRGLKQLNNRFELLAVDLALKLAKKENKNGDFQIFSDSQVAVKWANHPCVKWIPREDNLAGQYLEKNGFS